MNPEEIKGYIANTIEHVNTLLCRPIAETNKNILNLKREMLEERLKAVDPTTPRGVHTLNKGERTATMNYFLACVKMHPGMHRNDLRDMIGIPAIPTRGEQEIFRDCLRGARKEIYIDENERCWPRTTEETPYAKVGKVVLRGNLSPLLRKALLTLKENPGLTKLELMSLLSLNTKNSYKFFRRLATYTFTDSTGRFFVQGHVPQAPNVSLPAKGAGTAAIDDFSAAILDSMDHGKVYDWSQIVPQYRDLGLSAKDGFVHCQRMVDANLLRKHPNGYMRLL
jgi:hypothetical protein